MELAKLFVAGSEAHPSQPINPLLHQGQEDLVASKDRHVQRLMAGMTGGILSMVTGINDFAQDRWNSFSMHARAWFSIIDPNGSIAAANYPLSAWCAIYCVAAPDPPPSRKDSGQLRLYEARLANMFQDASTEAMQVPYRRGHYSWRPVAGRMAVFPAAHTHEVALNRSSGKLLLVTMLMRFAAPDDMRFAR